MDEIGTPKRQLMVVILHIFHPETFTCQNAPKCDLVFWVGEDIETFLEKPLGTVAKKAKKIELMESSDKKLKFREKNIFEGHR